MPKANARQQAKKKATYKAFLSSAVWKRLRAAAIERADFACERCHTSAWMDTTIATSLTVHHKSYARFGGDELPEDLEVRCKSCHDRHHALEGKRIA